MPPKRTATLTSKYQISIPKKVSEVHDWKPGTECASVPRGEHVVLVPGREDLRGIAKRADTGGYRDRDDRF